MKKLIGVFASGLVALGAFAEAAAQPAPAVQAQPAAKAELTTTAPTNAPASDEPKRLLDDYGLEFEIDANIYSAYMWRNAIFNDRPVAQPCFCADWTFYDPFYVGGYVWENNDLSNRRRSSGYRGEWNEFDYNVHAGTTLWENSTENKDDKCKLTFEVGHEWYTYNVHGGYYSGKDEDGNPTDWRRNRKDNPTTYEIYTLFKFENPYVTPYFRTSWEYQRWNGMYTELGLKKEVELSKLFNQKDNGILDQFSASADLSVSGGSHKYLDGLYTGDSGYGYTDGQGYEHTFKTGINGATLKGGLTWSPCNNFSLGVVIAYTATLSDAIGDAIQQEGDPWMKRNLVWGGFEAVLKF